MPKDNKPEDLESTIRLDSKQVMDPYANPAPTIESIEDVFGTDNDAANAPYHLPEEAIVSSEGNIDLSGLNKEVNELNNEFEFNILEESKNEISEDKPVEKTVTEKSSNINDKEDTAPKEAPVSNKKTTAEEPHVLPTEAKKEPQDTSTPSSETKEISTNTTKPSSGISIAMLLISLVALAAGFTGAWVSMSLQAQVDSLYTELSTMHNNRSNYLRELTDTQKQLVTLKQELATLQLKEVTSSTNIKQKPAIVVDAQKALPATITPSTPIKEVKPTAHKNTWNVIISSHDSLKKAELEQHSKVMDEIQTTIVPAVVKGHHWYRIVANNFASKEQAVNFTHKLKKQGIADAWVQHNK